MLRVRLQFELTISVDICHERRCGCGGTGLGYVGGDIRRQRVSRMPGFRRWRRHLDEMYVKLNGEMVYLWRAVDHEGEVLESYVTKSRDKAADDLEAFPCDLERLVDVCAASYCPSFKTRWCRGSRSGNPTWLISA